MQTQEDRLEYFAQRIINKATADEINEDLMVLTLTKAQLIDPMLLSCLKNKAFDKEFAGKKIKFKCADGDLFFKAGEFETLVENYKAIEEYKASLVFEETINLGTGSFHNNEEQLIAMFKKQDKVERSFEDIVQINKKLADIAEKINGGYVDEDGNKKELSPLEKYFVCYQVARSISYLVENEEDRKKAGYSFTRSVVDLIKNQIGCCVGISEYFRAILEMVGINNCCLSVDSDREGLLYKQNLNENIAELFSFKKLFNNYTNRESNILEELDKLNNFQYVTSHKSNLVYLKDEKYGIDGVFLGDATFGDKYDIVAIGDNFDILFNFATFFQSGDDISNLLDKASKLDLLEKNENSLDKDYYFNYAKSLLVQSFKAAFYSNTLLSPRLSLDQARFVLKLEGCKSYDEVFDLIEEKCSEKDMTTGQPNEYAAAYLQSFEKVLYDQDQKFLKSTEIKKIYEKLENTKFIKKVSQEISTASKVSHKIFDQIFEGSEYAFMNGIKNMTETNDFLKNASPDLKGSKNIVLEIVQKNGLELEFASKNLLDDYDVVLAAVSQNAEALKFASERLKNKYELVLKAVQGNGEALKFASEEMRNNIEIALTAIRSDCSALLYVPIDGRNYNEIVLEAVDMDGLALEFASKEMQDDLLVVMTAIQNDREALKFASPRFQNNRVLQEGKFEVLEDMISCYDSVKNIQDFPLSYFQEENRYILDFAMEIIAERLEDSVIKEEYYEMIEEIINSKLDDLASLEEMKKLKDEMHFLDFEQDFELDDDE